MAGEYAVRELAVEVKHLESGWTIRIPELGVGSSGFGQGKICIGAAYLATRIPDRIDPEIMAVAAIPRGDSVVIQLYPRSYLEAEFALTSNPLDTLKALHRSLPVGSALVPTL
ncbi:Uncharacterised protein [Mycobacteroides abscessus subsp. abscessus]|uniref:hypothetical protein n=1 Tax=Mycobacteroides abscessus TaxID=36809 RepID=UPI000928E6D9|nr:hypothetical protein [Mycobacteroides abscessus]SIM06583.1 Uncharacterised protein [Mycobacteroides abscessus subsp. abscessus]SLC77077.1 Uncharacterised protein [Mycobacteroides abscessus subsp. abscessus]